MATIWEACAIQPAPLKEERKRRKVEVAWITGLGCSISDQEVRGSDLSLCPSSGHIWGNKLPCYGLLIADYIIWHLSWKFWQSNLPPIQSIFLVQEFQIRRWVNVTSFLYLPGTNSSHCYRSITSKLSTGLNSMSHTWKGTLIRKHKCFFWQRLHEARKTWSSFFTCC